MTDIAWIHQHAYDHGKDPIDHATEHVAMFLEVIETIRARRAADPAGSAAYGPDVSYEHFGRRIVGDLLDAGWTPPGASS